MTHRKQQTTLAILYAILCAAFALAISTARDAMTERVRRCAEVAAVWAMYGPRDVMACDYGESGRDVWVYGGAW